MSPTGPHPKKKTPELDAVLEWLESKKKTDLEDTPQGARAASEEGQMVWRNCQNFTTLPRHPLPVLHPKRGE